MSAIAIALICYCLTVFLTSDRTGIIQGYFILKIAFKWLKLKPQRRWA
jgi:hypothetical protein